MKVILLKLARRKVRIVDKVTPKGTYYKIYWPLGVYWILGIFPYRMYVDSTKISDYNQAIQFKTHTIKHVAREYYKHSWNFSIKTFINHLIK